jgi:hypothetical protein
MPCVTMAPRNYLTHQITKPQKIYGIFKFGKSSLGRSLFLLLSERIIPSLPVRALGNAVA